MYPVTFAAENPGEGRNRLTTFFRLLIAIPWLIVGGIYGFVAYLAAIGAWFSIVFTGAYPEGLYNFVSGYIRFLGRLYAYIYLLTDEYPPFNGEVDPAYPVGVGTPPALAEYDRLKTGLRLIFGIPVLLLSYVQALIAEVVALIGWFAILFTGNMSDGFFNPIRSATAYQTRAAAYFLLITEDWPPFSLEDEATAGGQLPPSTPPAAPPAEGAAAPPDQQAGS
jgi:Domain of unknown function (DUF4389)